MFCNDKERLNWLDAKAALGHAQTQADIDWCTARLADIENRWDDAAAERETEENKLREWERFTI